jgi:hypothetical protein
MAKLNKYKYKSVYLSLKHGQINKNKRKYVCRLYKKGKVTIRGTYINNKAAGNGGIYSITNEATGRRPRCWMTS